MAILKSQRPGRKLKVKTGCLTCRARKVKCDEERPFCKRCRDSGRDCGGYKQQLKDGSPTSNSTVLWSSKLSSPRKDIYPDTALISILDTAEERQLLDFFCRHTGPALSGAFDTGFWTRLLPQLSHSDQAIRHALLAVGSLHDQYESHKDLSHTPIIASPQFTLQQYNQAIKYLKLQPSGRGETISVTLICCVLFISLECLLGNREVALSHLQNGLKILCSTQSKSCDFAVAKNSFGSEFIHKNLSQIFSRLDAQLTMFGKPASKIDIFSNPSREPIVPTSFNSILEAKTCMDTLIMSSLQLVHSTLDARYSKTKVSTIVSNAALERQLDLQLRLQQWDHSFEILMKNIGSSHGVKDQREILLLRIHNTSICIWLSTCLVPNEAIFDSYLQDFESIIEWSQRLGKLWNSSSVFVLDMAVIPPLFLTAIKCRCSWIRRKSIDLMRSTFSREGLWDARLHATVAEHVVAIEEAGSWGTNNRPSEASRIHNTEIEYKMHSTPPMAHLTFHNKPNGLNGDWCVWKEEITIK